MAEGRRYLVSHYSDHRFKSCCISDGFVKAGYVQVNGRGIEEGNFLEIEEFVESVTGGQHEDSLVREIDWGRFCGDRHLMRNILNVRKIDKRRLLGFIKRYQDEFEGLRINEIEFDATYSEIDRWTVGREKLFTYGTDPGGKVDIHTIVPAYPTVSSKTKTSS